MERFNRPVIILIYYAAGTAICLILLSLMPAQVSLTREILNNYVLLTVGFCAGILGKQIIVKYRWIALLIPLLVLVIGIF